MLNKIGIAALIMTVPVPVAAQIPAQTDILAQFKAGKLLCSNPDAQTKTCSTMDRLVVRADGTLQDTGETLISPDKPITVETTSTAFIEAGAICGIMDMADIHKSIIRVNGSPLPPDRNALAIEKLSALFQPLAGQKLCEGLRLEGGRLVKIAQVERVDLPLPGKPAGWIGQDEGYRVAPRTPVSANP